MTDTLVRIAVSLAISFGALILGLAVIVALRQRGVDPVGRLAGLFAPRETTDSPNGNGNSNASPANAPV